MATRASIFEEDDLDVSGFAPKNGPDANAPPAEKVREVAESVDFRSRESKPGTVAAAAERTFRGYRTGRNVQFNVKATQATLDAFYKVCEKKGWMLAEGFEEAVAALVRNSEHPQE